jgi:hypothetical protein
MVNHEERRVAGGGRSGGFEVLVTTDTNLRYQQNLASRTLAVVVLTTTSWPRIQAAANAVIRAVDAAAPATFVEVRIP